MATRGYKLLISQVGSLLDMGFVWEQIIFVLSSTLSYSTHNSNIYKNYLHELFSSDFK